MEETLIYNVYTSKNEYVCTCAENDAAEIAEEIGGHYSSEVVEYDENDLGEDRIVYSTEEFEPEYDDENEHQIALDILEELGDDGFVDWRDDSHDWWVENCELGDMDEYNPLP